MFTKQHTISLKQVLSIAIAMTLAIGLVVGLVARPAGATSLASVQSNIADVPGGANFIMKIRAHNDGDLHELEIDHSFKNTTPSLPEFAVYANESDPYGNGVDTTQKPQYDTAGLSVTYSAALSEWTLEFDKNGSAWTNVIEPARAITFYFVLKNSSGVELWGNMSPPTAENTFAFDLLAGTGDQLEYVAPPADATDEAPVADTPATTASGVVVPGVPNTAQ